MENYTQRPHKGIEKALEGVGFRIDEIVKQGNKTVITIFQCEMGESITKLPDKQMIDID